jgi:hypothetical protein
VVDRVLLTLQLGVQWCRPDGSIERPAIRAIRNEPDRAVGVLVTSAGWAVARSKPLVMLCVKLAPAIETLDGGVKSNALFVKMARAMTVPRHKERTDTSINCRVRRTHSRICAQQVKRVCG